MAEQEKCGDFEMGAVGGCVDLVEDRRDFEEKAAGGKDVQIVAGMEGLSIGGSADVSGLFSKAFPLLFPLLDKSTILACRSVSKSWKRTIDTFLREHPTLRPYSATIAKATKKSLVSPGYFPGPLLKNFQGVTFTKLQQLLRFNEQYKNVSGKCNPFFERSVTFIQRPSEAKHSTAAKKFTENVFEVLKRFGAHIWYMTLDITPASSKFVCKTDFEYYDRLCLALSFTPNLKALRLYGTTPKISEDVCCKIIKKHKIACCTYMENKPLPSLKDLQVLEFNSQDLFPTLRNGIMDQLLNQLKKLRITIGAIPDGIMPLTELEVCSWPDNQILLMYRGMHKFQAPKLKKLTIRMMSTIFVMDLFLQIVSYFPTATHVHLAFMPNWIMRNVAGEHEDMDINVKWALSKKLEFPNVKTLELTMDFPGVLVHKFIECFAGMEHLLIRTIAPEPGQPFVIWQEPEHPLDNALRVGRISDKVIWKTLPKLKEVVYVGEDWLEVMQTVDRGQWVGRAPWEWKQRPDVGTSVKRCTREMIQNK